MILIIDACILDFLCYFFSCYCSRALLGVDMRVEYESLDLPDISSLRPACVRDCEPSPTEQHFKSVQILNHKYEQVQMHALIFLLFKKTVMFLCH